MRGRSGGGKLDTYDVLSGLNKVNGSSVPAEGSRTGDEHGLALGGVEDLPQHADAVAEDGDERRRDVRHAGGGIGTEDWMGQRHCVVGPRHRVIRSSDMWEARCPIVLMQRCGCARHRACTREPHKTTLVLCSPPQRWRTPAASATHHFYAEPPPLRALLSSDNVSDLVFVALSDRYSPASLNSIGPGMTRSL